MSDRLDRALAVIDVGLQDAGGTAYGFDNGRCVRCQRRYPAAGSSWCARCVPGAPDVPVHCQEQELPSREQVEAMVAWYRHMLDAFEPIVREVFQTIAHQVQATTDALAASRNPKTCERDR